MSATFAATFSAVAVSAAQDVFELVAPSNSGVAIRSISLGQYSEFGDAQAELLSVLVMRGHTTSGARRFLGDTLNLTSSRQRIAVPLKGTSGLCDCAL